MRKARPTCQKGICIVRTEPQDENAQGGAPLDAAQMQAFEDDGAVLVDLRLGPDLLDRAMMRLHGPTLERLEALCLGVRFHARAGNPDKARLWLVRARELSDRLRAHPGGPSSRRLAEAEASLHQQPSGP